MVAALKDILGLVVFFNHCISFIYVLELNINFVTSIFFFSSEWIPWYIYQKTFNWKCGTNDLFVHEANSKEKNNRNKTKLLD